MIKNSPANTEDVCVIPESEDALEKGMATHSRILASHPQKKGLKEIETEVNP